MAESTPFLFSSTTDSSSAPVQSKIRRVTKFRSKHNILTRLSRNQNQSSVNPPNLTFTLPTQSTEPVHGNSPFSFIASASAQVGDAAAPSSSLPFERKPMPGPEAEQSLVVVSRILKSIPQSPHFYQLRSFSELTRKSLISGWDQVFGKTVEELQFLQVADFWVKAKELWKTMEELQSMGYNVILLRRRLVELTDVVMELKLAQMEIIWLRIKAENHRLESNRLESIALQLQELAKEEKESVNKVASEAAKKENELPNFDAWFAKLTKDPL